jgi:hypothetical protein
MGKESGATDTKPAIEGQVVDGTAKIEKVKLTEEQRQKLADCEKTIGSGLMTFIEVGTALATIRDSKLYLENHKTFEAYCRARWSLGRTRAYQLIYAADVASDVHNCEHLPKIVNEAQARELVTVPKDKRSEVWAKVVSACGRKPITAGRVRTIVIETTGLPPKRSAQASENQTEKLSAQAKKFAQKIATDMDRERQVEFFTHLLGQMTPETKQEAGRLFSDQLDLKDLAVSLPADGESMTDDQKKRLLCRALGQGMLAVQSITSLGDYLTNEDQAEVKKWQGIVNSLTERHPTPEATQLETVSA